VLSRITFTSADLFPTVAELAGIPKTCPDGISFAKILRSGTDVQRSEPLIWHFPHHRGWYGPGLEPYSAIRSGDFKAIFFYGTRKWELYNLANDLGETHDLAPTNASKLKELATILHDKLVDMQAQFPVDNQSRKQIEPNF
jgi:arylsulfatase A-like enzyme